jgi:Divergent InlB B-repeat domain
MPFRLGLRAALLCLTVVVMMIGVGLTVAMLAVGGPPASARAPSALSAGLASPPAVSSNVVVVTTTADVVNGDVSSVAALNANPGADGISLREALTAADATGGSATVYIMFSAALNGATIEVMSQLPPVHRDNVVLEGVAPDGSPARVTLDAQLAAPVTLGELLLVQASEVTVRWLRFTGVEGSGGPGQREAAVIVRQGANVALPVSPGPPQIANVQIVDNVFDNRGVILPPRTQTGPLTDGLLVGTGSSAANNTHVSGLTVARNTFMNYNDDAVGVWENAQGATANGVVIQDNNFGQNEYAVELAESDNGPSQAGARIIGNTISGGSIGITLNGNATNGTFDATLIEGNAISGVGTAINLDAAAYDPNLGGSTGGDVISNTQIVNNVIRANSASDFSGIRLAGGNVTSSPPSSVSSVTIENDTLVNDGTGALFISNPNDQSGVSGNTITGVIVRNSILYERFGTSPILQGGGGGVVNQRPDVVMNSLITGPGWAGSNGNINGDPLFVDEPGGDYHLTDASPAINAGTTIGAPVDDLDGALRVAQPDIGAYEHGATPRPLLTVTSEELAGSGTVTSSPAAINCGTACGARFDRNATVTLTATPGSESAFGGWSGGGCSGTGSCTVMMSADQTVTATFVPTTHALTVSPAGGGGSIAGTGITCPGICSASYASGTLVTLIASPASGAAFGGWSGGGCSGTGPCAVMMSSDQTVTATFVPIHTLTVARAGDGSGAVAGTGISCPGTCSASYPSGTLVTLIATPASGAAFGGWSGGGCTRTGPCTVTMSSDQTVTATFIPVASITAFKLTNARFTVGPRGTVINARASAAARPHKPKVPQGSAFLYTLSRASTATIVIERQTPGRTVGKRCVAQTKANARKKRCTITARVGTLTRRSKTGRNTIAFSGRIGRKALAPASYRATITARAGTGPTSKPRSVTFTIVHA